MLRDASRRKTTESHRGNPICALRPAPVNQKIASAHPGAKAQRCATKIPKTELRNQIQIRREAPRKIGAKKNAIFRKPR
jgi:hypothetical protein